MNGFQLFNIEIKSLFKKKAFLGSVIAALLVPLVYVGILLSPKWGPYDNLDNLPVAVVNNDLGAESNGEIINVGNQLVENLKANPTLKWDFVSSEEAEKGLKEMEYYMVIEVPEDFSANVTTVLDENPIKPELNFIKNEGLHFMASQVTNNAIETLRTQLSTQVTQTYVHNLFEQLGGVSDGFSEAADGSKQIYEGSVQLKDGTEQILDSLTEKAPDINRLAEGAQQLEAGAREILQNLTSKQGDIAKLADGAKQLNAGTKELLSNLNGKAGDISTLSDGAKQINEGTGLLLSTLQEKTSGIEELAKGSKDLEAGAQELQVGTTKILAGIEEVKGGSDLLLDGLNNQLAPGSARLADGVSQAKVGVSETISQMEGLYTILQDLPDRHATLEDDPLFQIVLSGLETSLNESDEKLALFDQLLDGANLLRDNLAEGSEFANGLAALNNGLEELYVGQTSINEGATELLAGTKQISAGNESVYEGWNELTRNVATLHAGTSQLSQGNASVEEGWQQLIAGATELNNGSSQISEGNESVHAGWQQLAAGAEQIHNGTTQISEGNQSVDEGWTALMDGVSQVNDGLGDLQSGSDELSTGLSEGAESTSQLSPSEENMEMFASPVTLNGEIINEFEFYRDSTVPYIMSLALFAGIVAMSFVVHFQKPAMSPVSGTSWFLGKLMNLSLLAIVQALIISIFALVILQVRVESSLLFILFAIFVSLTFLMMIFFLVALAGNFGRFIALALIVLQLSITGSDLPIAMLPVEFRELSVFLPLTYTIDGFTSIVSLGNFSNVWTNMGVLFIYLIVSAVLTYTVFIMKFRKNNTITTDSKSVISS